MSYSQTLTRVIEVYSYGGGGEHPNHGNGDFTPVPIPEVDLTISGGTLDGKAKAGAGDGWDVGLLAQAQGGDAPGIDYRNAFDVTVAGSIIRKMRAAGIYAETQTETRGNIRLVGQCAIKHTGIQGSLTDSYLASGIHAINREGYLGVTAEDSLFQFNAGNGVYLYDAYSIRADTHFPMGLFLGLRRCASHDNGGSGVALDGMKDKGTVQVLLQGANVGGTHDNFDPSAASAPIPYIGGVSLIAEGNEPVPADRPHGQGYIDRCAISHNGGAGVWTYLRGSVDRSSLPGDVGDGTWSVASCRIENTFLWENDAGGVRADLHPTHTGVPDGPLYLMPVVHSTLAHNGHAQGAPFNMEVQMALQSGFIYGGDPSGVTVQTELFNSIFERTTPTDLDWGPGLEALVADDGAGNGPSGVGTPHDFIGVAGVRASWSPAATNLIAPPVSLNGFGGGSPSPFVGPSGSGPNDPGQFFLTGPPSGTFYASPPFFTVKTAETDCKKDYSGDDRPAGGFTQWDKGGEEL